MSKTEFICLNKLKDIRFNNFSILNAVKRE